MFMVSGAGRPRRCEGSVACSGLRLRRGCAGCLGVGFRRSSERSLLGAAQCASLLPALLCVSGSIECSNGVPFSRVWFEIVRGRASAPCDPASPHRELGRLLSSDPGQPGQASLLGGGAGACWRCRQRIAFPRTGQRPGTMGFGAAGLVKPRTWVAARGPGLATL